MFNLSTPWAEYVNKVEALFAKDPEVTVKYTDGDDKKLALYVETADKAAALEALFPQEVTFGNIKVAIVVVPANKEQTPTQIVNAAFRGNGAVKEILHLSMPLTGPMDYVMFKQEVVQFFNDDLGDPNGNESTLYQTIARELFQNQQQIRWCTTTEKE